VPAEGDWPHVPPQLPRTWEKRLFIARAEGDRVTSRDAYEGKQGIVLRVGSIKGGSTIAEQPLTGLPVSDGVSAANGRLYLSLRDGRVLCLGHDR